MNIPPADIVQRQLDAYNARDIEAFMSTFSEDVQAGELGAAAPTMTGKPQMRERYTELFANSPDLYSLVLHRTTFGNVVIDHERILGRNGAAEPYEVLAIYEVENGLIRRVHFVRHNRHP